jgi:hypothetical protein
VDSFTVSHGHGQAWASEFARLIGEHFERVMRARWEVEFEWWTGKAEEKAASDRGWLEEMLESSPDHPSSMAATLFPVKLTMTAIAIALVFALLAFTVENEGCLPWQERVGYGDGAFGEQTDVSRCDGSWFPFGSALLILRH